MIQNLIELKSTFWVIQIFRLPIGEKIKLLIRISSLTFPDREEQSVQIELRDVARLTSAKFSEIACNEVRMKGKLLLMTLVLNSQYQAPSTTTQLSPSHSSKPLAVVPV